jgi:hypothetical protein
VMSKNRELRKFVHELSQAGLLVSEKNGRYVVRSQGGQVLGSFSDIEGGRVKQNLLAQIKRATGIVIETPATGGKARRSFSKNVESVRTKSHHGRIS